MSSTGTKDRMTMMSAAKLLSSLPGLVVSSRVQPTVETVGYRRSSLPGLSKMDSKHPRPIALLVPRRPSSGTSLEVGSISDFWYHHIHCDKETFHFTWRKLRQEYSMPSTAMVMRDGVMKLSIAGRDGVICELEQDPGGLWTGKWLKHERMPVALIPVQNRGPQQASLFAASMNLETLDPWDVGGLRFYCRPGTWDKSIADEVISGDCYHLKELAGRLDARTIVDVGAHIGAFTCWAKSLWPTARVVAYEPLPGNFLMLSRNTTFLADVRCQMHALGSQDSVARMLEMVPNTGGAGLGSEGLIFKEFRKRQPEHYGEFR